MKNVFFEYKILIDKCFITISSKKKIKEKNQCFGFYLNAFSYS